MSYPELNINPVINGTYMRLDVKIDIDPDASRIIIKQGRDRIVVDGGFFIDMVKVLERCQQQTDGKQSQEIALNTCPTSLSRPNLEF